MKFWFITVVSQPSDLLIERFGAKRSVSTRTGFATKNDADRMVTVLQAKTVPGWTKTYTVGQEK